MSSITVNQCQCGGVFETADALLRHIGASNDYDMLDELARRNDMETYRLRLHSNMSHSRERTLAEIEREQREVEQLQDARLTHPRSR